MSDVILETKGLTKDYGYGRGIFNINLEIHRGEVFGFIGTNGSGKTTTIRNMMGFIKPDKGTSTVYGMNSWKKSAEIMGCVSYIPGEIAFPPLATGVDFLKLQADYLGVKDFTYMNHVIQLLQLDPTANLKRMSKGMKQKTAIVAALMGEKEFLVMDEPTTGLDPLMREAFLELIREEKKKGHTIFMSSHIFEEIEEICDRVAMIRDGYLLDTVSLYDLRHPKVKAFSIEFEKLWEKEDFCNRSKFKMDKCENNSCDVQVPIEDLDYFFHLLESYLIINLQENHLSLQKHFLQNYRKGACQNEIR